MRRKEEKSKKQIDFSDVTPCVFFKKKKFSKVYKKVFFEQSVTKESDFSQDTSAWD